MDSSAMLRLLLLGFWVTIAAGQVASPCGLNTLTASAHPAPSVITGYTARLVAAGLRSPRSIAWDDAGHLLVLEQNYGISSLLFTDNGGDCLEVREKRVVVNDTSLNHGLAFSLSGEILYASSSDEVMAYDYDQGFPSVGASPRSIITGMYSGGHTTRTLLTTSTDHLIVSRGSNANIDPEASSLSSGRCQIRSFDASNASSIASLSAYDFSTGGTRLGWGLRNSVGVAEHAPTGGLWSVENSIDQMTRAGADIHENNPGEELNFHGFANGSGAAGGNYGYPECFAVWDAAAVPPLRTGEQMVMAPNGTLNDSTCADTRVPPRLTFPAHTAPLDIKFTASGTEAWVTMHGSWNRDGPVGYKVVSIAWDPMTGQPREASDSMTATKDVVWNADPEKCPGQCFRPVGLSLDSKGRWWMSSDATGEIYVITKTAETNGTADGEGAVSPTGTSKKTSSAKKSGELFTLWMSVSVGLMGYSVFS